MTIRRVAVLLVLAALGAFAAFGQSITPTVLPSPGGCTPPNSTTSCALLNVTFFNTTLTVVSPPAGTPVWSFSSGSVPPGLNIDMNAGTITGVPTHAGLYTFTASAVFGATIVSQQYSIAIPNGPLTIAQPQVLPAGVVGTAITPVTFAATGGVPFVGGSGTYQWSIAPGSQADGLAIDPNLGILTGTPLSGGVFSITIGVIDAVGSAAIHIYSFSVTGGGTNPLSITTTSLGNGVLGTAYSQTLQQSGGPSTGVNWAIVSGMGNLPPGLGIASNSNSTGTISGTPTAVGTYNFTVSAVAPTTVTATQALSITITATATPLTMANPAAVTGAVGQTVTMQFTAAGGITPYTYTLQSGSTPPGLTLSATTGAVTGTATKAGAYTFTIQVADSSSPSLTATATGTITITASLTLPNPTTVTGFVGQTITPWMQFTATGGTAPYTYSIQGGSLPGSLTLNGQTGAITGQATQSCGQCTIIVQVTDSSSPVQQASAQGTLTINFISVGALAITPNGALSAGTQPAVALTVATAPATQITGTLSFGFQRSFDGGASREVGFASSGSSQAMPFVTFTIAAGSTQATFTGGSTVLIVGTAAGFGTISANFQDALGNNITPPAAQPVSFSISGTAPVIRSFTLTCHVQGSTTTYTAAVIGYSSTLDMATALLTLTPTSGTNLASTSVPVPGLSAPFQAWYSSSPSNQFGGQFMLSIPLSVTVSAGANTNPIVSAEITLTNSQGTSAVSPIATSSGCS